MYFVGAISAFIFGLLLVFPAIMRSWTGAAGYASFFLFAPTFNLDLPPAEHVIFSFAFDAVGSIYCYVAIRQARVKV
jgi:hypothetical protein